MRTTGFHLGPARTMQVAVVAAAAAIGFATAGAGAAFIAAVVGFFAAKSADSLRRALV